jgi:hypothetical protein
MGRAFLIVMGVVGALAALDAVVLFFIVLVAGYTPYGGLLTALALPAVAIGGVVVAWTAVTLLRTGADEVQGDDREVHV